MEVASAARLRPADVLRVGGVGLRTLTRRALLSALGIAIGIASMVAVLGISQSSRADLLSALDRLGTNLLTVSPGESFLGESSSLPASAQAMVGRMPSVKRSASVARVDGATVRRSPFIDEIETGGIAVHAADPGLLRTLGGRMRAGRFLSAASGRRPVVVLGADAAEALGIESLAGDPQVWIGDRWYAVGGILERLELAPELDRAALIGYPAAGAHFGTDREASTIYVRARPDEVERARGLLGPTANPERPEEAEVSRPSDALAARAAARTAFTALLLGLGGVALLVGGVGIANVMVISVLERRSEIGLRRALGATRAHIAAQFASESLILAALGGVAGVALGAAVTLAYAASRGWAAVVPPAALGGGTGAALLIGAVAGLYPALRAARLSPTEALRST